MGKSVFSGLVAGAAVLGVIGGAAVAWGENGTDDSLADIRAVRQGATSSPTQSPTGTAVPTAGITVERGKQIALKATHGGQVVDVELEEEHGRTVWDIEIVNAGREYDVDVDAETGAVQRVRWDERDDDSSGRGSNGDDDRDDRDEWDDDRDDRDDDDHWDDDDRDDDD